MTNEDKVDILKNEYRDMLEMVTNKVNIKSIDPKPGFIAQFEVTVNAPSYYITGSGDTNPKPTDQMKFYVEIPEEYPDKAGPHVYYAQGKYLASINAYRNGSQCIDKWVYDPEHAGRNTTLSGAVRKTIMDIIHDPTVSRYDSMANSSLESWQRSKTSSGEFPTCRLSELIRPDGGVRSEKTRTALPVKSSQTVSRVRTASSAQNADSGNTRSASHMRTPLPTCTAGSDTAGCRVRTPLPVKAEGR